jgi:CDP-glucose 4,6-dehydratase
VIELFNLIIKTLGKNVAPQVLNQASNEIREQYLSSEKAKQLLGWVPQHTLEEGLHITADWYVKHLAN